MWAAWEHLADGPDEWMAFVQACKELQSGPVWAWLRRQKKVEHVRNQLTVAARGEAHSNSAAEEELRAIGNAWAGREGSYRNAARTNQLLRLMVLARRGSFDERLWADVISRHALGNKGHNPTKLRSICDQGGPSLRA